MPDDCITIALGLPEVRVIREKETELESKVDVEYRSLGATCPRCGEQTPKVHSTALHYKRDRRRWDKPLFLVLHKRRFRCLRCRKVFTEPDPICGPRRRTSQRLRRQLGQGVTRPSNLLQASVSVRAS